MLQIYALITEKKHLAQIYEKYFIFYYFCGVIIKIT